MLVSFYHQNTTVGTPLLTIQAVDADSAANGAVQYRFSNDSRLVSNDH